MNDDFLRIAESMGGCERHAAVLRECSKQVRRVIRNATFFNATLLPNNRQVRTALKKLRVECDRFTIALKRLDGKILWGLPFESSLRTLLKTRRDIEKVRALCDQFFAINKPRHGKPKPEMVLCAWVVSEVWANIHGRAPSHNNGKAQDACEAYWVACGQAGGNAGRWEYHIEEARRARQSKRYSWIGRALAEGK